ncbi:hypothetical protein DUNSADRAFT_13573 [Dunaliella salina]|uniref:Uncharacterized protein n=1 Tax=Dunaliella salina TaxID=3046 RepID=A0ABQ7H366_DUNSA|nr:hypothetical protein DUNSADRAFT_13573 [Dunaliella salina]|eukprot:KAF5841300.1 hypothetical protein DUNSADRAFT_13573 [Dunaliella salina]
MKSSTPQFPGPGEAGAAEGGEGMATAGVPTLAACIPGSAAAAAAAAATAATECRPVQALDICHLKNIPSALRAKSGEAASNNNAPAVPDDMTTTNTATTPRSGPPMLARGTTPSASLPHQGINIATNNHANSGQGKAAGAWQKPTSSWVQQPNGQPHILPLGITVAGGVGSDRVVALADQGLALPSMCPNLSQLPVPVVGETSGSQGALLPQPQLQPPPPQQQQQQQLWEQMEQQLGCESSGGAEHSVQQPEASKLNESMASWHALLFEKDQGPGPNKASEHQQCASAPNFGPQVDSSAALTGPKVKAFRTTRSSPGLHRQPSCSTLCTDDVRSSPPKAATTSPLGGGDNGARLQGGRAFRACSADFAGNSAQQQKRVQKDAPMTCANVFSTGLYAGGAAGGGAGAAVGGAAASIGPRGRSGSGTFVRSPHAAGGIVHEGGAEGGAQLAMGALRPRHSSPPTAEGGPPEPNNPATMATSGWRPSPPAAAAAALLQPQHQPAQLPSHPFQYQLRQHPCLQQQQQHHHHHQMAEGEAGMGLGNGDCSRPATSAPSHLHWWGGQVPAGADARAASAAAEHHVASSKPPVSDGMHAAAAAASAAAAGLDLGLARKRSKLDGGRSSYDSALGAQMQQQQQQQQELEHQDKPSAFQVVVTRKARSKRGCPTGRASRESVCSDNSLNHQAASRAAGPSNNGGGGILRGGSRGSLDTIGNACIMGSRHSFGGLAGAGVNAGTCQTEGGSGEGDGVGAGGMDTNSSRQARQQRPAPPRCLSRTGEDMEGSLKGGSGGASQAKGYASGTRGKGAGSGSNKRNAATLQASPQRTAAARKSQASKGKANTASDDGGDNPDVGDDLPGEGVDQSAAGMLLALSSGGTYY